MKRYAVSWDSVTRPGKRVGNDYGSKHQAQRVFDKKLRKGLNPKMREFEVDGVML